MGAYRYDAEMERERERDERGWWSIVYEIRLVTEAGCNTG